MKTIMYVAALASLFLILSSTSCSQGAIVKGSRNHIAKEIELEHFSAIRLLGSADITYQQAPQSKAIIYGSDNLIPLLETTIEGGILVIKFKRHINTTNIGKLEIKLFSPDLNSLTINGSGDVKFANGIKSEGNIELRINGSGNIQGESFNCKNMIVSINGSGDINLHKINSNNASAQISGSGDIVLTGKTTDAEYNIAGSGDIDASNLEATNVSARSSGSGDISCFANGGKLTGLVRGSGEVSYKGSPKEIDFSRKGLNKID